MLSRVLCVLLFMAWTVQMRNDPVQFCGLWQSPFVALSPLFESLPGTGLSVWQLMLFVLAPLCLFSARCLPPASLAMDAAILVSLASVALTCLWGWLRGGSAYKAYYQLWRFLAALLVASCSSRWSVRSVT